VDIDNKRIQLPEELPPFPQRSDFTDEILEVMLRYGVEPDKCRSARDRRSCGLQRKLSWSQESESGLVCVENVFMSSSISGFLPSPTIGTSLLIVF